MDLEQIKREMLWLQLECYLNVSLPAIKGLTRQPRDQIEADVCKTRSTQISKSFQCVCGIVRATEFCELSIIKRLRAKTRTLNSETVKLTKFFSVHTSRIGFIRNARRF